MHLIIDIDSIKYPSQKDWLFGTLKMMNISYSTIEKRQTLEEYNQEIEEADAEIERGEFTTAENLKKEAAAW